MLLRVALVSSVFILSLRVRYTDSRPIFNATAFRTQILDTINAYRTQHCVGALQLDLNLTDKLQRSLQQPTTKSATNSWYQSIYEGVVVSAEEVVRTFSNEEVEFDFDHPKITKKNENYVKLIWKSFQSVAIASYTTPSDKLMVIIRFLPGCINPNNLDKNVLRPTCENVKDSENIRDVPLRPPVSTLS